MKPFLTLLLTIAACYSQCTCTNCVSHKSQAQYTDPWFHVIPGNGGGYGSLLVKLVIVTNWTSIGEFTWAKDGSHFDVQEGTVVTNTVAVIDYDGHYETILKSAAGPSVGERRVFKSGATPNVQPWNYYFQNAVPIQGGGVWITNGSMNVTNLSIWGSNVTTNKIVSW